MIRSCARLLLPSDTMTRRIAIAALAFAWLAASVLSACAAPQAPDARDDLEFTQLAPGVWMHTSYIEMPPWGRIRSNGLVVVSGEHVTLVDTAWNDEQTDAIVRWAVVELGRSVDRAVFTHAHVDKMGGVAALRRRGIETWAAPDSNALAPTRDLVPAEHDLTFDASGVSHDLAPLVVFDPGAGHTTDNIVVALPDLGLVFGGCLIRPPGATDLGNTADGDIDHWAAATRAVAEHFAGATIVVPSHGDVGGRELFALTIELAEGAAR